MKMTKKEKHIIECMKDVIREGYQSGKTIYTPADFIVKEGQDMNDMIKRVMILSEEGFVTPVFLYETDGITFKDLKEAVREANKYSVNSDGEKKVYTNSDIIVKFEYKGEPLVD